MAAPAPALVARAGPWVAAFRPVEAKADDVADANEEVEQARKDAASARGAALHFYETSLARALRDEAHQHQVNNNVQEAKADGDPPLSDVQVANEVPSKLLALCDGIEALADATLDANAIIRFLASHLPWDTPDSELNTKMVRILTHTARRAAASAGDANRKERHVELIRAETTRHRQRVDAQRAVLDALRAAPVPVDESARKAHEAKVRAAEQSLAHAEMDYHATFQVTHLDLFMQLSRKLGSGQWAGAPLWAPFPSTFAPHVVLDSHAARMAVSEEVVCAIQRFALVIHHYWGDMDPTWRLRKDKPDLWRTSNQFWMRADQAEYWAWHAPEVAERNDELAKLAEAYFLHAGTSTPVSDQQYVRDWIDTATRLVRLCPQPLKLHGYSMEPGGLDQIDPADAPATEVLLRAFKENDAERRMHVPVNVISNPRMLWWFDTDATPDARMARVRERLTTRCVDASLTRFVTYEEALITRDVGPVLDNIWGESGRQKEARLGRVLNSALMLGAAYGMYYTASRWLVPAAAEVAEAAAELTAALTPAGTMAAARSTERLGSMLAVTDALSRLTGPNTTDIQRALPGADAKAMAAEDAERTAILERILPPLEDATDGRLVVMPTAAEVAHAKYVHEARLWANLTDKIPDEATRVKEKNRILKEAKDAGQFRTPRNMRLRQSRGANESRPEWKTNQHVVLEPHMLAARVAADGTRVLSGARLTAAGIDEMRRYSSLYAEFHWGSLRDTSIERLRGEATVFERYSSGLAALLAETQGRSFQRQHALRILASSIRDAGAKLPKDSDIISQRAIAAAEKYALLLENVINGTTLVNGTSQSLIEASAETGEWVVTDYGDGLWVRNVVPPGLFAMRFVARTLASIVRNSTVPVVDAFFSLFSNDTVDSLATPALEHAHGALETSTGVMVDLMVSVQAMCWVALGAFTALRNPRSLKAAVTNTLHVLRAWFTRWLWMSSSLFSLSGFHAGLARINPVVSNWRKVQGWVLGDMKAVLNANYQQIMFRSEAHAWLHNTAMTMVKTAEEMQGNGVKAVKGVAEYIIEIVRTARVLGGGGEVDRAKLVRLARTGEQIMEIMRDAADAGHVAAGAGNFLADATQTTRMMLDRVASAAALNTFQINGLRAAGQRWHIPVLPHLPQWLWSYTGGMALSVVRTVAAGRGKDEAVRNTRTLVAVHMIGRLAQMSRVTRMRFVNQHGAIQ